MAGADGLYTPRNSLERLLSIFSLGECALLTCFARSSILRRRFICSVTLTIAESSQA
jgi:hypothetical protein